MPKEIPEYIKIRQYVFGNISNSKQTGGKIKLHTEAELCKIFGVCRITVRKALSMLVEEGLLVRKPRLGTFVRQEIVDEFSEYFSDKLTIGLVYCDGTATFLSDYYFAQTMKIYERLLHENCMVRLTFFNGNPEMEAEQICQNKLDGVIWLSPTQNCIPAIRVFKSHNIPVVSTFAGFVSDKFDGVIMDYYKYGYMIAKYLIGRGHRKILFLNKDSPDPEKARKAGTMAAFAESGIVWDDKLWYCTRDSFKESLVKKVIKQAGNVTAVNCNELHVNYVRQEFANRKDVQVLYHVFSEQAANREGIPVILYPVEQAGSMAAEMLMQLIKQPKPQSSVERHLLFEPVIFEPKITTPKKETSR